jgi:hypothetical protein
VLHEEILNESFSTDTEDRFPLHGEAVLKDERLAAVVAGGLENR